MKEPAAFNEPVMNEPVMKEPALDRPVSAEATPEAEADILVASYNIHGGVGTDGRFSPRRICGVLSEIGAEIVALQEVETRATGFDMLSYLAEHSEYYAIPGPTLVHEDGDFGNALLTRFPPTEVSQLDLSVPGREPRGAIDAMLDCREHGLAFPLRVIATHLGLRPGERRYQVARLLASLAERPGQATVLLGDLNEWFLWGRPLRWLHAYFEGTPHVATFPSQLPFLALDRVWTSPRAHLISVTRHRSALARRASDHLPLLAALRVPAVGRA